MALQKLAIDGYGQIELNNCAFRRDGRIEAQCKLNDVDFENMPAENGMLLAVDNVTRTISLPTEEDELIALVYTAEHLYDERAMGLKNFKSELNDFLPRLGYLALGDKFTTNCVCYDDEEYADDDALKAALTKEALAGAAVYGGISELGRIKLSATEPEAGPVLKVVLAYTMPDGQYGIKLQCVKA